MAESTGPFATVGMTFFEFITFGSFVFCFQNCRLEAGVTLTPSVYRGEPARFVRNGEMARGVEIDKCFPCKAIKFFIFFDFRKKRPAHFGRNGEMAVPP